MKERRTVVDMRWCRHVMPVCSRPSRHFTVFGGSYSLFITSKLLGFFGTEDQISNNRGMLSNHFPIAYPRLNNQLTISPDLPGGVWSAAHFRCWDRSDLTKQYSPTMMCFSPHYFSCKVLPKDHRQACKSRSGLS